MKSETIVDGIVTTNFEWTKAEVLAAIGQAKAEQVISEGTPLYASAIMRVVTGSRTNPIQVSDPIIRCMILNTQRVGLIQKI